MKIRKLFFQNIFHATRHNKSIWGAFEFIDPIVEEKYKEDTMDFKIVMAWFHSIFLFIWSLALLAFYLTEFSRVHPAKFWSTFARCLFSLVFFFSTFFSKVQRNINVWHACFCITYSALLGWMIFSSSENAVKSMEGRWASSFVKESQKEAFLSMMGSMIGSMMQNAYTLANHWQMIALAFMGFSRYTVPAMLSFPVAFFISLALDPHFMALNLICTIIEQSATILAFLLLSIWMEQLRRSSFITELLLAQELHNSQACDSILNHTLKNILADAAGNIEVFLTGDGVRDNTLLADGLLALRRGIRSCQERQAFLKLVSQTYVPSLSLVNLVEFGQQLITGRPVQGNFPDKRVLLDPVLCNLIFNNGINNAFRHGCPDDPDVRFIIQASMTADPHPAHLRLDFHVNNRANPQRGYLTNEFVAQAFTGGPMLRSGGDSYLSDQIGLSHCQLAAKAMGMSLSLTQDGDRVSLSGVLIAKCPSDEPLALLPYPAMPPQDDGPPEELPIDLTYFLLEDSLPSMRLLVSQLSYGACPGKIRTFGQEEGDLKMFVELALTDADVVICDQNLEYGRRSYRGSDFIAELRAKNFQGLLCIRSADMEASDIALYRSQGAHCTLGKDLSRREFLYRLQAAYMALKRTQIDPVLPFVVP